MGNRFLNEWRTRLDVAICSALREQAEAPLLDMMLCATEGGDRTLGLLTLSCCDAAGGDAFGVLNLAAAVEMIYAAPQVAGGGKFGSPGAEKKAPPSISHYGAACANVCAYALVAGAFETALRSDVPDFMSAEIVLELARATGAKAMALQQCKALCQQRGDRNPGSAPAPHGIPALFNAAAKVGALGALATPHTVEALGNTGRHIGLAYQAVHGWLDRPAPAAQQEEIRRHLDDHLGHAWVEFGKAFGRFSGSDLLLEWQGMLQTSLGGKIRPA